LILIMNTYVKPFHRGPMLEANLIALIDARYLRWLARQEEGDARESSGRDAFNDWLRQVLLRHGVRSHLLRTYWYTDRDDLSVVDDQTLRLVPAADLDGVALVRQLSADLQALVAGGRVDAVCIASDDDRLMGAIESAKLAGVSVYLLADERAQSMSRLMNQDPGWARLLREADRRILVRAAECAQALSGRPAVGQEDSVSDELDASLRDVVRSWWEDLVADDQDTLREELPGQRGLPPEVDRELLLRAKNTLGRSLNFQEKRILRSWAREQATGVKQDPGAVAHEQHE
jgi:hypothetical protein